jgi:hypothetical protein
VSALDAKIDELYTLPLNAFTGARNALAKSLSGDEAKRVKALAKPTVVPWAVNQLYWRARATYDRLMKSGEKLRAAQVAALEGRHADVRGASEAHRRAIGEAVAEAERLAAAAGAKPGADALARTFESLSLATSPPAEPGRLTEALQPAGFEALMGANLELRTENLKLETTPAKLQLKKGNAERRTANGEPRTPKEDRLAKAAAAAAAKEAARAEAERQKHEQAVKKAEEKLASVDAAEREARHTWERAHDDLLAARQALADLRRTRFRPT